MNPDLLVVCEGNLCRSPMAQGLLARALPDATVYSAGISATPGMAAHPIACELMAAKGIDLSSHRSIRMTAEHVMSAGIVLTMTNAQKRIVEQRYPVSQGRVFRIGHRLAIDVFDPYRFGRNAFEACLAELEKGVEHWIGALRSPDYQV